MMELVPNKRDPVHDDKNNQKFKISTKNQFIFNFSLKCLV